MYIKRKLETTILEQLKSREILAIVGPRQAGKTTMLKQIHASLDKAIFLTFEDREELELFEQDIKIFAKKYSSYKYIFIDEFQYSKKGGKNLKFLYDLYPEMKIIISGSSAIDLTIRAIKFLVGRVFVFNLYQLDFEEFLNFRNSDLAGVYQDLKNKIDPLAGKVTRCDIPEVIKKQLHREWQEFIIWGGYPRVALADSEKEKRLILKNIYNTYFLRDIRDVLGLVDDFKFAKLIKALAVQIGQLVEYNELRKITDYDYLTLKKYLNILEKTFICQSVRPFFRNKRTEIVKNPKIYFFDTGLRNYAINDFNALDNRADKGFLYENFIFNQLNKRDIVANFWRSKNGAEVDFVMEINNLLIPIESKSGMNGMRLSRSFLSFLEQYQPKTGFILSNDSIGQKKVEGALTYFLPHYLL